MIRFTAYLTEASATTEVFREFLFANAVRGTAFWELYYSPSIMDEAKWQVTADALAWAEENHEILKNAKLFGNQPKKVFTAIQAGMAQRE